MFQLELAPPIPSDPIITPTKEEKMIPNRSIEVVCSFDSKAPIFVDIDFQEPAPQITETYLLTEVWKELTPEERLHLLHISCCQKLQTEREEILPFLRRSGGWYSRKAVQLGAEGLR